MAAPVREEGGAVDVNVFRRAFWNLAFDVIPARDNPGDGKWRLESAAVRILADAAVNALATREEAPAASGAGEDFRAQVVKLLDELIAHIVAIGPDKPDLNTPMSRRVWREVFTDLIIALRAQPQAREEAQPLAWRSIDSAPKDGTVIDTWRNEGGRDTVFWGYPHHECGEMGSLCDSDWHSIRAPGWVCNTFNEFLGRSHNPFTHWKPLDGGPDAGARQEERP
jgi:hypothetical protein